MLLRAARRGDRRARERLVVEHLGLVRGVASRYRDYGLPLDDLVQEGSIGLLDAIDRYDPARGSDFASYARCRIRRAIRNALTDQARLIRLPKQIVERRRAIDSAEDELLAAADGHPPAPADLAAATGLPVAAVLEARAAALAPVSLDEPVLPGGSTLEAAVADPGAADPETEAVEHEQTERLHAALARLPARQRRIIRAQWGLDGRPRSTTSLASVLRISPRRTQTIGEDALYELRRAFEPPATG